MNKHSTVRLALTLFITDLTVIILNLLLLGRLFGLVESTLYDWGITILLSLVLYMLVWIRASQEGKAAVDADHMSLKRFERNEIPAPEKFYFPYKGFVAGLLSKLPVIVLLVLRFATGSDAYHFPINVFFGVHYSASLVTFNIAKISTGELSVFSYLLSVLCYIVLFSLVSGLAYMTGPAQREKVLTVIKRNEEKYKKVQNQKPR